MPPNRRSPRKRGAPPEGERKAALLAAAIDYVKRNGGSDLSLRQLASALGTSHRMLVYHFGSKEELLIEVIRAFERQERELIDELAGDVTLSEVMRRLWRRARDPALASHERLFVEMYGQALQGRPHTAGLLGDIVESWLRPLTARGVRRSIPEPVARANARLCVAVTRGLILDLLATGDRKAVDDAMDRFLAMYDAADESGLRAPVKRASRG